MKLQEIKLDTLVDKNKLNKIAVKSLKPRDPNWQIMQAKRTSNAMGKHTSVNARQPKHKLNSIEENQNDTN